MEFLDDRPLNQHIWGKPLQTNENLDIAIQAGDALDVRGSF